MNGRPAPAKSFARGPLSDFGEIAAASAEEMVLVGNSNARRAALVRAYDERIKRVYELTGQELDNPLALGAFGHGAMQLLERFNRPSPASIDVTIGGDGISVGRGEAEPNPWFAGEADLVADFDARIAALKAQYPDKDWFETSIEDEAVVIGQSAAQTAADLRARARGWVSGLGGSLAGGLAGSFNDPLQVATLPVGFGSRTIAGAAVKEGLLNAGIVGVVELTDAEWRKELGLDYGAGDFAMAVGTAGLFGAGLGGGGKAIQQSAGRVVFRRSAFEVFRQKTEALPIDHPFRRIEAGQARADLEALAMGETLTPERAKTARAFLKTLDNEDGALDVVFRALDEIDAGARVEAARPEGVAPATHRARVAQASRHAAEPQAYPPPRAPEPAGPKAGDLSPQAEAVRARILDGLPDVVDIARGIRDFPDVVDAELLEVEGRLDQAMDLARLSDEVFTLVERGRLAVKAAAVIGRDVDDPALQMEAAEVLLEAGRAEPLAAESVARAAQFRSQVPPGAEPVPTSAEGPGATTSNAGSGAAGRSGEVRSGSPPGATSRKGTARGPEGKAAADPTPENLERAAEAIERANDAAAEAADDIAYTFGGPRSVLAKPDALARAMAMDASGATREAIWARTWADYNQGWFKGVDGKWRFEIDDSGAAIALREGKTLAEALEHPELYAAYPELAGFRVKLDASQQEVGSKIALASFDRWRNTILIGPKLKGDPAATLSSLLHEIQHGIQKRENTLGAVLEGDAYRRSMHEVEARNVQARAAMTPGERRLLPPWETQDVWDNNQLIARVFDPKQWGARQKWGAGLALGGGGMFLASLAFLVTQLFQHLPARALSAASPADALKAAARGAFGEGAEKVFDVVDAPPAGVREDALAWTDRSSGKVTLNAARMAPEQVRGVLLHEIGAHHGMQAMLGKKRFGQLLKTIETRRDGSDAWRAAWAAVPEDTPANLRAEEALGYFLEMNPELAVRESWWGDLTSAVRRWAHRTLGWDVLDDGDIVALAAAAVSRRIADPLPAAEDSIGEAVEWAGAREKGLELGRDAREARRRDWQAARDTDADVVEQVFYRGGGGRDVKSFRAGKVGELGGGVYLTPDPEFAGRYATMSRAFSGSDPTVYPVRVRGRFARQPDIDRAVAAAGREIGGLNEAAKVLDREGFDGIYVDDGDRPQLVVFDPGNIRSVNAAFDPDHFDSANLLYSIDRGDTPDLFDTVPDADGAPVRDHQAEVKKLKARAKRFASSGARLEADIEKAFTDGEIDEAGAAEMRALLDRFRQARLEAGDDPAAAEAGAADDVLEELSAAEKRARWLAALNRRAALRLGGEMKRFRNGSGEPDAGEFLQAVLEYNGQGSGLTRSVEGLRKTIFASAMADMEAAAHHFRAGIPLRRIFRLDPSNRVNAADVDNFLKELFGEDTKDATAKALARITGDVMENLRQRYNRAGGQIGKLENWGGPQSHDAVAIRNFINKNGREAFKQRLFNDLDHDAMRDLATGQAMSPSEIYAALDSVIDNILTDGWISHQPVRAPRAPGAKANGRAEHRFLKFRDADTWLQYQRDFGGGDPISSIVQHIQSMSRDIAAMEVLGPNPSAMIEWLKQVAKVEAAKRALGRGGILPKRFKGNADKYIDQKSWRADVMWFNYTGAVNVPVNERFASASQFLGNWLTGTILGSAILSALPSDPVFQQMARAWAGSKQHRLVTQLLRSVGRGRELRQLGMIWDHNLAAFGESSRYGGYIGKPGASAMIPQQVLAAQGLTQFSRKGQELFAGGLMADFGNEAGKAWDAMEPALRRTLHRYGFAAADWDRMRAARLEDGGFLSPRTIRDAAPGADLGDRFHHMLMQEAEYAVPSGSLRSRSLMLGKTQPGHWQGELARSGKMFLAFSATLPLTWGYRIYHQMQGPGRYSAAAFTLASLAFLTAGAAVTIQLRALRDGKDLQDMDLEDPKFWGAAALQSGGLGIYGDFLFSDVNRIDRSFGETITGPRVGTVSDLKDLTAGNLIEAIDPDKESDALAEWSQFAARNVPGSNLPYLKLGYDRWAEDALRRATDPDAERYFRNRIRRQQRETGQGYWWAPGRAAPERLPDAEAAID